MQAIVWRKNASEIDRKRERERERDKLVSERDSLLY